MLTKPPQKTQSRQNLKTLPLTTQNQYDKRITHTEDWIKEALPQLEHNILVEKKIGQGGMGIVYLAEENIPCRNVAIKRLLPESLHLKSLLIREAMITGELEHPNIIPIHRLELNGEHAPQANRRSNLHRA